METHQPAAGTPPALLEARGLCKDFSGFRAVDGVDLRVRQGSIHALIGPNGAGKSTCFNLLTKFVKPSAGRILLRGQDVTHLSPAALAQAGVVRSFQISAVFARLSVLDNVVVALQRQAGGSLQFWRPLRVLRRLEARALELLQAVGLAEAAQRTAGALPYGQRRALELATTLALEPDLLLLDEPTQGMGHEDVDRITALIAGVARERTVLLVEHNMAVVSRIADTITVLQRGRIIAEGDYATVSRHPQVVEAYMGREEGEEAGGALHA
jgi:branched-chain amino acid transport system ATP-binding protein